MTVLLHTDHMNKQLSGTGNVPFHLTRPVPPNTSDLNPADYRISGEMQQRLYELKVLMTLMNCSRVCLVWLGAKHDQ